jgi:hypothetical protein
MLNSIPNLDELAAKLKCHPSIPCGVKISEEDIVGDWYRLPTDTLPQGWFNDWSFFEMIVEFYPDPHDTSPLDTTFKIGYDIQYPIKGVMYTDMRSDDPIYDDAFIFQDANEDYFVWGFYQERTIEDPNYMRRYKIPRGTLPEEFVRNFHLYKEEMEDIHPLPDFEARYEKTRNEQFMLARIRGRVKPCACYPGDAKEWYVSEFVTRTTEPPLSRD